MPVVLRAEQMIRITSDLVVMRLLSIQRKACKRRDGKRHSRRREVFGGVVFRAQKLQRQMQNREK